MLCFGKDNKQERPTYSIFQTLISRIHPISVEPAPTKMTAIKIIVFIGSNREGRMVDKVANCVKKSLEKNGLSVLVFDPVTMDFESIHQPLLFLKDKSRAPAWFLEADEDIKTADGFVVVHSEYNCGVPPALSHMINCFPPSSFKHRPCSIVTYSMGDFGGVRAAALVQPFLSELGMIALPSRVTLPTVHTKFGMMGEPKSRRFLVSVERMVKELAWYAEALKKAKEVSNLA